MENNKTAAQTNGDRPSTGYSTGSYVNRGLTKREHFAGLIMAELTKHYSNAIAAKEAVDAADELLKALEIKTPQNGKNKAN